jgi:hypothetical protein
MSLALKKLLKYGDRLAQERAMKPLAMFLNP